MRRTRLTMLSAAALLASVSLASAADLQRLPAQQPVTAYAPTSTLYNWTGVYLGGHLGYSRTDNGVTFTGTGLGGSVDADGLIGGGQIGANWQFGAWVLGLEGDLSLSNANGNATIAGTNITADHNWYATLAGRFGYAFDRWLVYGKGGAAWAGADYSTAAGSASATRKGWMVGAGVEYGLTPNLSAKLEYNYLDLGTADLMLPPAASIDSTSQTIKAGVNYRFNWDGPTR